MTECTSHVIICCIKSVSGYTLSIHQRHDASHLDWLQILRETLIDVMDAISKKDHVDSPFY
ncbi:hypothetical protein T05_13821 [Trichinella murrelli]|uniref:Uncharacterized protein n=1 Tax=Trichinella murrelli TaxID=144512 RepID=A0A0V0T1Q7_9BILA|nr:hypothetical protein T05_13821 [Trichinella murrelli]